MISSTSSKGSVEKGVGRGEDGGGRADSRGERQGKRRENSLLSICSQYKTIVSILTSLPLRALASSSGRKEEKEE